MLQLETLQTVGWNIHRVGSFANFEIETTNPKEPQPESENQYAWWPKGKRTYFLTDLIREAESFLSS